MDANIFDQLLMLQPESEPGILSPKIDYPAPGIVTKIIISSNGDVEVARKKLNEKHLDFFDFEFPEGREKAEIYVRDICAGKCFIAHVPHHGMCTRPYCVVPVKEIH